MASEIALSARLRQANRQGVRHSLPSSLPETFLLIITTLLFLKFRLQNLFIYHVQELLLLLYYPYGSLPRDAAVATL